MSGCGRLPSRLIKIAAIVDIDYIKPDDLMGAQMLVYKDNFGFSNISEPEERSFFGFVWRQSVLTTCERCERPVRLIPSKALCASCVSALGRVDEFGMDELFGIPELNWA